MVQTNLEQNGDNDFNVNKEEQTKIEYIKKRIKDKKFEGFFYQKTNKIPSKDLIEKAETYIKINNININVNIKHRVNASFCLCKDCIIKKIAIAFEKIN